MSERRAFQFEASTQAASSRRTAFDPRQKNSINFDTTVRMLFGRVISCVPYARTYKVQLDGFMAAVPCRDMAQVSFTPHGPKQINTYSPGTGVLVAWHPQLPEGFIVAAFPDPTVDPRYGFGDFITMCGRTGVKVDAANSLPLFTQQNGGVSDFSMGRPTDSVGAEWGVMAETGLGFFLDPFQTYVRVDEETGLFLFYFDQLTRLAGHNLQVRSLLAEREELDDRGEITGEAIWSTFSWEAQGRPAYGSLPSSEINAETAQLVDQDLARFEPSAADQVAFNRYSEYRGYLGQASSRFLAIPPNAVTGAYTQHELLVSPGVFSEQLGTSGRWAVRSAKSITIGKTPMIQIPKRVKSPADPTGDGVGNYRPAGIGTEGPQHYVQDTTAPIVIDGTAGVAAIAASLDSIAYEYNWLGVHPFYYHTLDWYLPEVNSAGLELSTPPLYANLAYQQYLPLPPFVNLEVDHRQTANYYASDAFFRMNDDGSIEITDGYGASIRMSQGSIFISAPADIWIESGKNTNVWSGNDVILKARNGIDATTSVGDVRVKAQKNALITAGHDGCGGVLIESVASAASYDFSQVGEQARTSGVLIISRSSPAVVAGQDVVITTNWRNYHGQEIYSTDGENPSGETPEEFDGGSICIDSGRGYLNLYGQAIKAHVGDSFMMVFADSEGKYTVNEFWKSRAMIGSPLDVDGRLFVNDKIEAYDAIASNDKIGSIDGRIYKLQSSYEIEQTALDVMLRATDLADYAGESKHDGRSLQEDGSILPAQFTFRTEDQYLTTGLVLYETPWRQMARITGQNTVMFPWNETVIVSYDSAGTETLPYPGLYAWTINESYRLVDLTLYNANGQPLNRGTTPGDSPYETPQDPQSPTPIPAALSTNYFLLYDS